MIKFNSFNLQIRINKDILYITSLCENFCNLYKIDPFCVGKSIDAVFDRKTVAHLYSVRNFLLVNDIQLTELQELRGNFYIIKYSINSPFIHINASQIDISDINCNYCKYICNNTIPTSYTDYIIAEKKQADFIVTDIGYGISDVTGLKNRSSILPIFSNLFHFKSCKIFEECLSSNSVMHFIDIFENNKVRKYIFITLIPMKHTKEQICIEIKIISRDTYYSYQQLYNNSSFLDMISLKNTAAAIYSYSSAQDSFDITDKNEMFDNLLYEYEKVNALINGLLTKTLKAKRIAIKKFIMDNVVYTIAAAPHIMMKKMLVLIFQNEDFYESYSFMMKKLTNRESDVSKYLFSGKNLKNIASELNISPGTVKKTASNIYKKLNVESRAEFMHLFLLYEFIQI